MAYRTNTAALEGMGDGKQTSTEEYPMSQEFETRILEESSLAALSAGERLTLVAGLWSSLPTTAQILVVEVTAMIMRLPVPMADSDLAVVLAGWPTLTATDKRVLTYVVRTESDDGR